MSLLAKYEEFQNICRTCLFIGKLRPIIDSVVIKIIRGISGIDVKNDADLPQKICESCFKKIYKINEFAVQCKRNELALNKCKTEYFERKTIENAETDITIKDEMIQIKEEMKEEPIEVKQTEETINSNKCSKQIVHEEQFAFKCDVCNKLFRYEMTLKRHKLIHKTEQPQCDVCFKFFFDCNALKIHRRTHMFACEMCNKSFNSAYFLSLHYQREHPVGGLDLAPRSELKKVESDVVFEEVVIKLDSCEPVLEETHKNEYDPFETTTITSNDENKNDEEHNHERHSDKMEEVAGDTNLFQISEEPLFSLTDGDDDDGNKDMNEDSFDSYFDGKRIRERNFCMFCRTTVLNFVRHITRNHSKEPEVRRVLATTVGSRERKNLLSLLRKRGNYLINLTKCTKPVKKSRMSRKFLPCVYCLGFYSSNQLWKHRKVCIAQTQAHAQSGRACTAQAQNLLVHRWHQVDETLREWVFPRMRADDTSLVAKNDALICAVGARYLRAHRDAHAVHVTFRKMRELAKLLVALRSADSRIEHLVHALDVTHFDVLVAAVKRVAQFDEVSGVFASATYAAQIGPALRQCCEIALLDEAIVTADVAKETIRNFVAHLDSHWRTAVPPLPVSVVERQPGHLSAATSTKVKTTEYNNNNKTKRVLVRWTSEQKRIVDAYFKEHIFRRKAPKKRECEALLRAHPILLHNKSWLKIKVYVQNKYSK